MTVEISINGRKVFGCRPTVEGVVELDKNVQEAARRRGVPAERLGMRAVNHAVDGGGIGNDDVMLLVVWQVLSQPTGHPNFPGRFRDHIDTHDFEIDFSRTDAQSLCMEVEATLQGRDEWSWLN
jgi:hypothetical protein